MNLLQKLFNGGNKKSADQFTAAPTWVSIFGEGSTGGMTGWQFLCIDAIADAVSGVELRVAKKLNGEDVDKGPIVDLLDNPNGYENIRQLMYHLIFCALNKDAVFTEHYKAGRPMVNTIEVLDEAIGYKYSRADREMIFTDKDGKPLFNRNIAMFRLQNQNGWKRTPARDSYIKGWLDMERITQSFGNSVLGNGAFIGGILETKATSKDQIELLRASFEDAHQGAKNAGKSLLLPRDTKFTANKISLKDLEFSESDKRVRDKVLAAYRVPKSVLGITEDVNRATTEAAHYAFTLFVVSPILAKAVEFLNNTVVADLQKDVYITYDDPVPENNELKLEMYKAANPYASFMTVNEIRAEQGLDSVPNGDSLYYTPMAAELGTVPQQAPEPEPMERMAKMITAKALASVTDKTTEEQIKEEVDEAMHKLFVNRSQEYEDRIKDRLYDYVVQFALMVDQELNGTKDFSQKGLLDFINVAAEKVKVSQLIKPILTALAFNEINARSNEVGIPLNKPDIEEGVDNLVDEIVENNMVSYIQTNIDKVKEIITEETEGESALVDIVNRVTDELGDEVRGELVARTVTYEVANRSSIEAYRTTGVVKTMRYYTARDERVCPICFPINGKIVDVNDGFYRKGDTYNYLDDKGKPKTLEVYATEAPPMHPRCRCFVRPETIEV